MTVKTGTISKPQTQTPVVTAEAGNHDRFAHIIRKKGGGANAKVTEAHVFGTPLEALCGKRWVPSRDPKRYPMCPTCREKAEQMYGGGVQW